VLTFLKNPNRIMRRVEEVVIAWGQVAPASSFAGMTLAQFESEVAPSITERNRVAELEAALAAALGRRAQADINTNEKLKLVVSAVKGDPAHGENSALYRAMGYVPMAERASGLTRKAAALALPANN
jgi:hypothetical protein